jgi:hypothetical protein
LSPSEKGDLTSLIPIRHKLILWGVLFFTVVMVMAAGGFAAYLVYISRSGATWAQVEWAGHSAKYVTLLGFFIAGSISGFFSYRWANRRLINQAKYLILKAVTKKGMSEEQAAKELGIGVWAVKNALKELRKEGVVE